jgi:NADH dehydrogenase
MKILLTGGTGYIGSALRRELKDMGHDVRLLVRRSSAHKVERADEFEIILGDVLDSHACLKAVEGCHAVVNLVGVIREFPNEGTSYEAMHTETTYNLVDAARRVGVERVIQMSGLGARPDATARYHQTKYEAEEIVRKSPMRWTIFRPSVVFGPGDEFHAQLIELAHRPVVPIIDGGKALLQPVSLRNVVEPMARAVTMPETQGRIFEVGGPERVAFVDLLTQVARHFEVWMNTMKVRSMLLRPAVKMMQRFKSFPLTVDQMVMLLEDNTCDTKPFEEAFGVELDPYKENLARLLDSQKVNAA